MLTLTLSPEDISGAPPVAQAWIAQTMGFRFQNPKTFESLPEGDPLPFQSDSEEAQDEVEQTPDLNGKTVEEAPAVSQITKEDLQEKAKALIVTDEGKAVLKKALAEMGIQRVSACPDDRLAELLSKIAVA